MKKKLSLIFILSILLISLFASGAVAQDTVGKSLRTNINSMFTEDGIMMNLTAMIGGLLQLITTNPAVWLKVLFFILFLSIFHAALTKFGKFPNKTNGVISVVISLISIAFVNDDLLLKLSGTYSSIIFSVLIFAPFFYLVFIFFTMKKTKFNYIALCISFIALIMILSSLFSSLRKVEGAKIVFSSIIWQLHQIVMLLSLILAIWCFIDFLRLFATSSNDESLGDKEPSKETTPTTPEAAAEKELKEAATKEAAAEKDEGKIEDFAGGVNKVLDKLEEDGAKGSKVGKDLEESLKNVKTQEELKRKIDEAQHDLKRANVLFTRFYNKLNKKLKKYKKLYDGKLQYAKHVEFINNSLRILNKYNQKLRFFDTQLKFNKKENILKEKQRIFNLSKEIIKYENGIIGFTEKIENTFKSLVNKMLLSKKL
jgi:hypothetical protein